MRVGMVLASTTDVRVWVLLICLLLVTGCAEKSPVGPSAAFNERFTLAPGETAILTGSTLRIQFSGVVGDSRCPADAVCILGGDAIVRVVASGGGEASATYDLHTGDASQASAVHGRARITLVELQPYPFSSRTIPPQDYRATFVVTR